MIEIARTEKDAGLRRTAIRNLSLMGAHGSYRLTAVRRGTGGGVGTGIGAGAGAGAGTAASTAPADTKVADTLVSLYSSEQDAENRKEIIRGLFLQQNGKGLVELARKETNPELKKEIIRQLSLVHSKESTDYLRELLNK